MSAVRSPRIEPQATAGHPTYWRRPGSNKARRTRPAVPRRTDNSRSSGSFGHEKRPLPLALKSPSRVIRSRTYKRPAVAEDLVVTLETGQERLNDEPLSMRRVRDIAVPEPTFEVFLHNRSRHPENSWP